MTSRTSGVAARGGRAGAPRRPKKTALATDIRRSIARSKGRFASILLLMALGSFALVGLFVAGPDMRATGRAYFGDYDLADVTVLSDYGLTSDDVAAINEAKGLTAAEFGYFKDVTIDGTTQGMRISSMPGRVSQFELVDGRMPEAAGEIAVDAALADQYAIGDTVTVSEKPDSLSGSTVLTTTEFTVVGHVNSPEFLSKINMGQSTAGTGSLKAYAVVTEDTFDSDVYMAARLTFADTEGLDPYSTQYRDAVQAHKDDLSSVLEDRPAERLEEVKADAQEGIDEGQRQVDDAKSQLADAQAQLTDAEGQLTDAADQIAAAKAELSSQTAAGRSQLEASRAKLDAAASQLASAHDQLAFAQAQIADGESQLADGRAQTGAGRQQIEDAESQLASSKATLEAGEADYAQKKAQFDDTSQKYDRLWPTVSAAWESKLASGAWSELDGQRAEIAQEVARWQAQLDANPNDAEAKAQLVARQAKQAALKGLDELKASYDQLAAFGSQRDSLKSQLTAARAQLDEGHAAYESAAAQLAPKKDELSAAEATLAQKESQLASACSAYDVGMATYQQNLTAYQEGLASYQEGVSQLDAKRSNAQAQIDEAQSVLDAGRKEYEEKRDEFEEARPEAEQQIADGEADLAAARERVERLSVPLYETDSRREALGSEAYVIYDSVSEIIDSLSLIFPVFLFLVAALVTLSTMTRMVDEERICSGTYKALGYSDADIMKKFVVYGALAGGIGSVVGIALGHTLMPMIVYSAYGHAFTLPPIHLGFYPLISLVALGLALLCSVVPALLAAKRELAAKPAELLLPKAPRGGSTILLERVKPVWRRLSFTHKVTARNLFRYKQRMLMTVLGVAGAACMLVTGFGVQSSIAKMGSRQFGQILKYDLIVAHASTATDEQLAQIDDLLASDGVKSHVPIHYEAASRVAGTNNDKQDITLIVPEDTASFGDYVSLLERASGTPLELGDTGAVISERLADLVGLKVGDTLEFTAADGATRYVTISGITEMYMGHFLLMSPSAYEDCFGESFAPNADMVSLDDSSIENVERFSSDFMGLDGVRSVVQNTTLETQVNTVVNSLDKVMRVLIVVAALLGIVIMYNLTNLNVSERMRELSTIKVLGFHTNETTMYIYRETILLTALGLLVGFGLGVCLHEYILAAVPPDNVMFNPALSAIEFVVPAAVVAAITVALYFVVLRRLRCVDMLEALKSVE